MKLQNIPLADIVPNPWRDMDLFPIDDEHVKELRQSIGDHGFFGGVKGRRRGGKVETGCGHARVEAARKERLGSIPIYIDDLDDDAMLRLMTDENATQTGSNPGAIVNEVAAVTRRLIRAFAVQDVTPNIAKAFESKAGMERARSKLRNGNPHLALGHSVIRTFLGQGNPNRSNRSDRQILDAMTTLKQSGRYDDIVEAELLKYPVINDGEPAKGTAVVKAKERPPRRQKIYDDRCVSLFPETHQATAFREAVTTEAGQKAIPVAEQYPLAKKIMSAVNTKQRDGESTFRKKYVGAPFIKVSVQSFVRDKLKAQRDLDKDERERYLAEQREERIDAELYTAKASVRSLISAIAKLIDLAEQFPAHPKLGGFSARLDDLSHVIDQFARTLKPRKQRGAN